MLQSRSKKPLIHALVELWAPDSMETDLHKECTSHSQLNLTRNMCVQTRLKVAEGRIVRQCGVLERIQRVALLLPSHNLSFWRFKTSAVLS